MKNTFTKFLICFLLMVFLIPVGKITTIHSVGQFTPSAVINILYCGIICNDTFSIASKPFEKGGVNLYFPVDIKYILINSVKIQILKVDSEFLTVEVPSR